MSQAWGAGIVHHGSPDDLERCLTSLAAQTIPPTRVHVYDTGQDPDRLAAIARRFATVEFESGENLGFAGGANRVIGALRADPKPLHFALLLNPDVELDPDFAERLLPVFDRDPRIVIATGKLLRPDRRTLDSAGIVMPRHRRPRDRGSEQLDQGQFDRVERVDGASGAAMALRLDRVDALSLEGELFDTAFFAYHEDTDLCWRARRFGFEIVYVPEAVAVHARGWQRSMRMDVPVAIRRHSFKNHYLQLMKNETGWGAIANLPWLVLWEGMRLGFALLRDPEILPAYRAAWRLRGEAWRKRGVIGRRAAAFRARSAS